MFAPAYVGRKRWAKPTTAFTSSRYPCFIRSAQGFRVPSPLQRPGAPYLARFCEMWGYHRSPPQASCGPHNSVGVPHVRTSVRGPKTMGEAPRQPSLQVATLVSLEAVKALGVPHVRTSVARISYYAAPATITYAAFSQRKPHEVAQRHQP